MHKPVPDIPIELVKHTPAKPRILIFIDWFLPGFKAGGPIQSCANLVGHLQQVYDFWVITRDTDYCETDPYATIQPDAWNTIAPHLQVYYISGEQLKFSALQKAALQAKPDVIFINGIYSFYFSMLPLRIAKVIGCRQVIVSARGMLAPSAIQVKGTKKKLFLQTARLLGLYKGVRFHATNQAEAGHIRDVFGTKPEVKVAPNLPKPTQGDTLKQRSKVPVELKLVSVARISPEKNTLYALQVLDLLAGYGTITLDLFGPVYDETYWQKCIALIKQLPPNVQVNYKGSIDSSLVHETLQNYHALFLPTRGENFGHTILESLAAGLPVVISDQTPWKDLQRRGIGYDIPLQQPELFEVALRELLALAQEEYARLSGAAFAYAQEFMSDPEALELNKALFKF